MKKRVGDTLIEVALAIGIFSMVAIAIVAVMTSGSSNAQTALETTLAREEIDTQAEALRFIHTSYIAASGSDSDPYVKLWDKIISRAINPAIDSSYASYVPDTCQEAMSSELISKYGFIINPRALANNPEDAYIAYNSDIFQITPTYPRLIFSASEANNEIALLDPTIRDSLYRSEGLYVMAVQDSKTTQLIDDSTQTSSGNGYYDFYVRTCWYGSGSNTPSTISTIVRLYNPPTTATSGGTTTPSVKITYYPNGGSGTNKTVSVAKGETITIPNPADLGFSLAGTTTNGWNTMPDGSGLAYAAGSTYTPPAGMVTGQTLRLYAIYDSFVISYGDTGLASTICASADNCYISSEIPTSSDGALFLGWQRGSESRIYQPGDQIIPNTTNTNLKAVWGRLKIVYDANGGTNAPEDTNCTATNCTISSSTPLRDGYSFLGWSTSNSATSASYTAGQTIDLPSQTTTLYAVWALDNSNTISFSAKCSPTKTIYSCSFYAQRKKADGSKENVSPISSSANNASYQIDVLEGETIYFYIKKNHSGITNTTWNGVQAQVTPPQGSVMTTASVYKAATYWNVFSYKNGEVTIHNTFNSSPQTDY